MRFIRHPFFERDLIGIVNHIVEVTNGDIAAAGRRLDQVDALLQEIFSNPTSGVRLSGKLDGWLVRHGGAGHRLTIVFKPDIDAGQIYLALVAFGGRDWMRLASTRHKFSE
ncbi:type II toxin-antitoxin system RelE/ParE family toxin [Aliiroseovarius subalbicans]|uniref:type II toxin-antitoxin system RelE/ParE family toxin n=1 Tax=Aliiroseovarius subalbicans TaxID=2925840 RepID=UPI001F56D99A|nr:type II toxin-antitoxin system RelE/ParE family toxin [Aliiroseovarius subalbicans]MCI2400868.1 type II toxin-antitoxin system RelE/ParE family toxin [Aliiroseovarius subalbicans]